MYLRFEWDPAKDRANLKKHGISFEDAKPAFLDVSAVLLEDMVDEDGEQRYHLIGFASTLALLVVVHSYRTYNGETSIRIISARKAAAVERRLYRQANS